MIGNIRSVYGVQMEKGIHSSLATVAEIVKKKLRPKYPFVFIDINNYS